MLRKVMVAVPAALAALVVLAPAAAATPSEVTARIGGLEYAATDTEGRFGGAAEAPVAGAWLATVVHDPLDGEAVPITGGSFRLRGRDRDIVGTFVDGSVAPRDTDGDCGNEQFDVDGTVELDSGGRGAFEAVLTHLRTQTDTGCRVYGAVVRGSLTVPDDAVAT